MLFLLILFTGWGEFADTPTQWLEQKSIMMPQVRKQKMQIQILPPSETLVISQSTQTSSSSVISGSLWKEMKGKPLTNAITLQKSRRFSNKGVTDDLSGRASGSYWDHCRVLIFTPPRSWRRRRPCIPHMLQGSQLLVVNVSLTPNQLLLWSSESF